jgi:hypothetical protein
MPLRPILISFAVPGERAIAAEMAGNDLGRMQAINRIRQRGALQRAGYGRNGRL